jgi:hypothetical protein
VSTGDLPVRRAELRRLPWVKSKVSTNKVLQIDPKEHLKRRTGKSPDYADAFVLTFTLREQAPNIRLR